MIFRNHFQLGLLRRVVVYYLFFCMAAVCWLAFGVVLTTQSVVNARSEHTILSKVGQAAAAIEMDFIREDAKDLEAIVQRLKSEGSLAYCAVVGVDGKYLAHTTPNLAGKSVVDPKGTLARWGDVEGICFRDDQHRSVREYRVPLQADKAEIGSLRAAAIEPDTWGVLCQALDVAPLAILVPLLLVGAGAVVLSRQAGPLAQLEGELRRLARLPMGQKLQPRPLVARTAAVLGWNRVIESFQAPNDSDAASDTQACLPGTDAEDANNGNVLWRMLNDGLAVSDSGGVITRANQAWAALLRQDLETSQLRGTSVDHCLAEADLSGIEELVSQDNQARAVVCEAKTANAVLRIARQPMRNDDGALAGHLWSLRDITQQKLAEQMRDQFMDAATHELRTPLANIKAYAETLAAMDELDLESQKEFCNTINSEATRLARFVDDMLSISSMEVGSLAIERQNVDLQRLVDEVVEKIRPLIQQKSLDFDVQIPPKLPELWLDKDKFVAMLVNLLGNAAKYTPEQGRVALKVQSTDRLVQIDVEDTGIGIAADELPQVFDKFFRSKDPRVLEQSGTGLGLSLSQEIVRLHGGDISLQSEVDKGTTITVTVPLGSR